jgi:hypothetical protein
MGQGGVREELGWGTSVVGVFGAVGGASGPTLRADRQVHGA